MRRRGPKPPRNLLAYGLAAGGLALSLAIGALSIARYGSTADTATPAAAGPTTSAAATTTIVTTVPPTVLAAGAVATSVFPAPEDPPEPTTAPPAETLVDPAPTRPAAADPAPSTASTTRPATTRAATTRPAAPRPVVVSNARVSTGKTGGRPVDAVGQLPLDAKVACVFWQTTGIDVGSTVEVVWLVEGTRLASASRRFTWNYADGTVVNWCAPAIDGTPGTAPLPPGRHAVALQVGGRTMPVASFRVG